MDMAHLEDLHGRMLGLVIRLDDRIPGDKNAWLHEFARAGEYEECVGEMSATLGKDGIAISDEERADILTVAGWMGIREEVAAYLRKCPRAETGGNPETATGGLLPTRRTRLGRGNSPPAG